MIIKINAPEQRSLNPNEKRLYKLLREGKTPEECASIPHIRMKKLEICASDLYCVSKRVFFRFVPPCHNIHLTHGTLDMHVRLTEIAASQTKAQRIAVMALVLTYADEENKAYAFEWLSDYCSAGMQHELFDVSVGCNGELIPGETLEKAINKLNKRKR